MAVRWPGQGSRRGINSTMVVNAGRRARSFGPRRGILPDAIVTTWWRPG